MVELLPWIVLGNVLGTTFACLMLRRLARHNGDSQAVGAWAVPAAVLALAGLYLGGQGMTTTTITAIVTFGVVVSIGVRVIPSIKNPIPHDGSSQSTGQ